MSEWKFFTDEEMKKWVGPRCPEVEPGCAVCKAWARRDLLRQWEYEDEQDRLEFLELEIGLQVHESLHEQCNPQPLKNEAQDYALNEIMREENV